MENPFEIIMLELAEIKDLIYKVSSGTPINKSEIINRKELCSRLGISSPTAIKYTKSKRIPSIRIGGSVKYNWGSVVDALEKIKK